MPVQTRSMSKISNTSKTIPDVRQVCQIRYHNLEYNLVFEVAWDNTNKEVILIQDKYWDFAKGSRLPDCTIRKLIHRYFGDVPIRDEVFSYCMQERALDMLVSEAPPSQFDINYKGYDSPEEIKAAENFLKYMWKGTHFG